VPRVASSLRLFLSREIHALGIKTTERKALHAAVADLVHPLSPSNLSEAGVKELNKYSHGGFDALTEEFANPPQAIETFLPLFKQFMIGQPMMGANYRMQYHFTMQMYEAAYRALKEIGAATHVNELWQQIQGQGLFHLWCERSFPCPRCLS